MAPSFPLDLGRLVTESIYQTKINRTIKMLIIKFTKFQVNDFSF